MIARLSFFKPCPSSMLSLSALTLLLLRLEDSVVAVALASSAAAASSANASWSSPTPKRLPALSKVIGTEGVGSPSVWATSPFICATETTNRPSASFVSWSSPGSSRCDRAHSVTLASALAACASTCDVVST